MKGIILYYNVTTDYLSHIKFERIELISTF